MAKRYFIQLVASPDIDPRKCAVGLACAAQAINDGHQVDVFFASFAVKLLNHKYITGFDDEAGAPAGTCMGFIQTIIDGANGVHCSTGSMAAVGVTPENADGVLIGGWEKCLEWSGPPGVIELSTSSEVALVY